MTLARQLVTAISAMFLAMLVGVEAINLGSARSHLQDQLESHAQDAATSIGLSLGILLSRGDYAIAETVINAAFDRGNYAYIEFVTLDKAEPVVARRMPADLVVDYPDWLPRLFPLTGPTAESLVNSGWKQLGKVRVTSHPRFAYEQLWQTARDTLVWMLVIYAIALAVLYGFLQNLLRPLSAIERAADAISQRDFVTIGEKPRTRELARVVDAMNSLSDKVRGALEAETARAAALQDAAYLDPVSALLNRSGLGVRFNSHFRDETESFSGTLALLQITDLAQVNETQGPERGDELVRGVAKTLAQAAGPEGLAGRWGGALFALVVPEKDKTAAIARLNELQRQAEAAIAELGMGGGPVGIAIGAVYSDGGKPVLKDLVEGANDALQQAADTHMGAPEFRVLDSSRAVWSDALIGVVRQAITSGRMHLVGQPALALHAGHNGHQEHNGNSGHNGYSGNNGHDGGPLHTEIMGRLLDGEGRELTAAEFMPLVARYDLTVDFDQSIVRKVLYEVRELKDPCTIAINLAAPTIADANFLEWLTGVMGRGRPQQVRLVFEVSEHGVLQDEAAARTFAAHVAGLGAALAIDHFGVHRDSLALVRRLAPAYVKLSAVHTRRVVSDMGTRFFIESLVRAGQQLDVPVIAQAVEDEAIVASLRTLGVHGYQGFHAGRPVPWPAPGSAA